jgi:hypothetical protein
MFTYIMIDKQQEKRIKRIFYTKRRQAYIIMFCLKKENIL